MEQACLTFKPSKFENIPLKKRWRKKGRRKEGREGIYKREKKSGAGRRRKKWRWKRKNEEKGGN